MNVPKISTVSPSLAPSDVVVSKASDGEPPYIMVSFHCTAPVASLTAKRFFKHQVKTDIPSVAAAHALLKEPAG